MQEPSKQEIADYVAEVADQLAAMCRRDFPTVAKLLEIAAELTRGVQKAA